MPVPFTTASEPSPGKLPAVLVSLRGLAEKELEPATFYGEWLATLCTSTGALAGRCWLAGNQATWRSSASAGQAEGIPELPLERLEELRRDRMPILAQSSAVDDEASVCTEIWAPWLVAGELRGAVVVVFAIAGPQAQQGCLRFLLEANESVERFHLLHDRRAALRDVEAKERELELDAALRRSLDLKSAAAVIANDGRLFLGCDRLTVLVRRGRTFRVAAVSGQTALAQRAGAVRALRSIAAACAPLGERIVYPSPNARWDAKLTTALDRYVDEHFVKRFIFVPLLTTTPVDERKPTVARDEWLGALVIETFADGRPAADEAHKIDVLARSALGSLRSARQYESLFLLPVWRVLGTVWQALFGPGKLLRSALIAAVFGAAVAALFLTNTEFTAYSRGTLQPVSRQRVFAPLDGVVRETKVKHGSRVRKGDALVKLENTDLDIAEAELRGKLTATEQQKDAANQTLLRGGQQLSDAEKTRLEAEVKSSEAEIATLKNQIEKLKKKIDELTIVSPIDGEITTWNADDLLRGRPVRQGQQLLTVAAVDGDWELELNVPDERSGRVVEAADNGPNELPKPLRVTFSPAVDPSLVREAHIVEIQNSADLQGDAGNVVLVRAAIDEIDPTLRRPGAEVAAHVHCGRRSTGYVWTRDLVDFVRSRILFRWF